MGYLAKQKSERRERVLLYLLLLVLPLLTLTGTVAAGVDWNFDYIGEFKVQGAVISFVLALFCIYKRRLLPAGLFLFVALMNLALIASHYHFSEQESDMPANAPSFTFLYQDLTGTDKRVDTVAALLAAYDADVVLLSDVPVAFYERLNEIKGTYVLQNQTYDTNGKMMLILARTPGTARGLVTDAGIWVSRIFGDRKLTIVLTSLGDVWNGGYHAALQKVSDLSRFAQTRDEPVLLVGDLKATNWSFLTDDLKATGKLEVKEPLIMSYPAELPSFLRRPVAAVYAHRGVDVVGVTPVTDLNTTVSGVYATVKMAPVKKEVVFYDLQPTVSEGTLLSAQP